MKFLRFLLFFGGILLFAVVGEGCSKPVYYSSKRVYIARKNIDKNLKKKGYSNQQYKRKPTKKTRYSKRKRTGKRRYKYSGFKKFGKK
ncbi:MAG TPA: hypothetical protein DDX92_04740 [Flavobacteriales bacterium]|jgi:hypothetical protein|nr:hypothetical protein [Flavobacteriales bacterium]